MAGSIPVVFSGDKYKLCDNPAENNFKSVGAPFLYVESWDEFPDKLSEALSLGVHKLQQWQDDLTTWCVAARNSPELVARKASLPAAREGGRRRGSLACAVVRTSRASPSDPGLTPPARPDVFVVSAAAPQV